MLLTACRGSEAVAAIDPYEIGDPENGRQLFENGNEVIKMNCAGCHSLDGTIIETASGSVKVPSLQGISEHAGERIPGISAVDYLRESILQPEAYIVEGYKDQMERGYKYGFSEKEVNDLIAFLLTQ